MFARAAKYMTKVISYPSSLLAAIAMHNLHKDVPLTTIFRGAVPSLITLAVFMFVLILIPQLAIFLPSVRQPGLSNKPVDIGEKPVR